MNEHISRLVNHPQRNQVITGVVAFAGGGALGYFLGRRQRYQVFTVPSSGMALDVTEKLRSEPFVIDEEVYIQKGSEFVTDQLNGEVVGWVDEQTEEDIPEEPREVVTHNVFAETDDDWNYEEELKHRNINAPYVLHKDEFYADEKDYTQKTLTYYAGDNILVDEDEAPVYNHEAVVGALRFGHGSGDDKVFYVRNDRNMAEYEIIKDEGLYSVEVLGLEIENNERVRDLKHSSVLKFRDD